MEKDIVDGKIGEVGSYDLEFKGGKLSFKLNVSKPELGVGGGVFVEVGAAAVIDAIAAAIPGKVDDAILGVLKAALLGV